MTIQIDQDDIKLIAVNILFSFIGWLFWTGVFYLISHISLEWV